VAGFIEGLARKESKTPADAKREFFEHTRRPSSLLRRFAEPEKLAAVVVIMCSPQASATI